MLIHQYGPHIFHTNSRRDLRLSVALHRVAALRAPRAGRGATASWCRCRSTARRSTRSTASTSRPTSEAEAFLASRAEPVETIRTSEDVVVSAVGRELYETFFRGYTRKQWGLDPSELDKSVTARVPTRTNTDDRYFTDTLPGDAARRATPRCSSACSTIPTSTLLLGVDYRDVRDASRLRPPGLHRADRRIFRLPLRQAALPLAAVRARDARPGAVPAGRRWSTIPAEDVPYTRITEYKHLTGQEAPERPASPTNIRAPRAIPTTRSRGAENQALFKRYEALADATERT